VKHLGHISTQVEHNFLSQVNLIGKTFFMSSVTLGLFISQNTYILHFICVDYDTYHISVTSAS